jgi:hypothetical protein
MANIVQIPGRSFSPAKLMDAHPSWDQWRYLFLARVSRPIPQVKAPCMAESQKRSLGRSLAIFQLGESGEGRIAKEIMLIHQPGITIAYREALGLFVAEEARHGRLLKNLLASLGMGPMHFAWSNTLFTWVRRLIGIRLKLLVLMAAEIVGLSFYQLVSEQIEQGGFRAVLEQICEDEEDHLGFHADFFHNQLRTKGDRIVFKILWPSICLIAISMACFDHRDSLRSLGIRKRFYFRRALAYVNDASDHSLRLSSPLRRPERQSASAE